MIRNIFGFAGKACCLCSLLISSAAQAAEPASKVVPARPAAPSADPELLQLHGYVQPVLGVLTRSRAVPRDETALDFGGRFGLILSGARAQVWTYKAHVLVNSTGELLLGGATLVDRNGDGTPEELATTRLSRPVLGVEQLTVGYEPSPLFRALIGKVRIPFTVANSSVNNKLMFPDRSATNETFLSGADLGLLLEGALSERRYRLSLGLFEGSSLGLSEPSDRAFGPVYSLRADAEPLGELPQVEGDFQRGPFRFGVGGGLLARRAQLFDGAGYGTTSFTDLRGSLSLRVAVSGFYAQLEALRRQRVSELSARPQQATGVYGQFSYFIPLADGSQGIQPVARGGFATVDEAFDARRVLNIDAGLAYFPVATGPQPDAVRVLAQYVGEHRIDEDETAHGFRLQCSVSF